MDGKLQKNNYIFLKNHNNKKYFSDDILSEFLKKYLTNNI